MSKGCADEKSGREIRTRNQHEVSTASGHVLQSVSPPSFFSFRAPIRPSGANLLQKAYAAPSSASPASVSPFATRDDSLCAEQEQRGCLRVSLHVAAFHPCAVRNSARTRVHFKACHIDTEGAVQSVRGGLSARKHEKGAQQLHNLVVSGVRVADEVEVVHWTGTATAPAQAGERAE